MKPQTAALLRLLRAHPEGVTPLDVWRVLHSYRAGARVYELRRAGYDVRTSLETSEDGARFARYRLVEPLTIWTPEEVAS